MSSLDAELERHKEMIRGLFNDMCQYAMVSYNETLEIGIFGQLLENEESRVGSYAQKVDPKQSLTYFILSFKEGSNCQEKCV